MSQLIFQMSEDVQPGLDWWLKTLVEDCTNIMVVFNQNKGDCKLLNSLTLGWEK